LPLAFWLADGPEVVRDYLLLFENSRRAVQVAPLDSVNQPQQTEERLGEAPPAPEQVSARDYEQLLKRQLPAAGRGVSLGPLSIALDRFWASGAVPHQWLEIRCLALPNLALMGEKAVQVDIERVGDTRGRTLYDAEHMYEKEVFRKVALRPDESGGTWSGNRDVYLLRGAREEDISEIRGQVHLNLPLAIKTLELTPSMMGQTHKVAGQKVRFLTMRGGVVQLEFPGGLGRVLRIVGYNDTGQPLAEAGSSWSESAGGTTLKQIFQGEVFSLKIIVAGKIHRYSYPFVLKAAGGAPV